MSYSYSTPVGYNQTVPTGTPAYSEVYDPTIQTPKKKSSLPTAIAAGVAAGGISGFVASKKNPMIGEAGEITDTFVKQTFERYLDDSTKGGRAAYEQSQDLIKELKNVKWNDKEKLKKILSKYPEATAVAFDGAKKAPEDIIKGIKWYNTAKYRNKVGKNLSKTYKVQMNDVRKQIASCWDADAKKLVKADNVTDDMFNAMNSVSKGAKRGNIMKQAGKAGASAAVGAFIVHKILTNVAAKKAEQAALNFQA